MSEIKKKMSKNDLSLIIRYCVTAVVGVLFCISPALGETSLSVLLGIGFIVIGAVFLCISLIAEKSLISINAFIGYFAVAFGILCIDANIMYIVFSYVPYLLITAGAGILLDGVLSVSLKTSSKSVALLKLILGGVILALGICLLTVDKFKDYASVVLGVILIIFAVYGLISLFSKNRRLKAE